MQNQDYLNDIDYFFRYNEDVVENITNVIIPYISQFEHYSSENHFNRIIQILLESDISYEDIYYSLGVYLLSQSDNVEEQMTVIREILRDLQEAELNVVQQVMNIIDVFLPAAEPVPPPMENVKLVVRRKEMEKLKIVIFSDLQTDETNCSICLEDFEVDSELYVIPCTHLFHVNCLEKWVTENYKCPVCRGEIAEHEADLEDDDEEENEEEQ